MGKSGFIFRLLPLALFLPFFAAQAQNGAKPALIVTTVPYLKDVAEQVSCSSPRFHIQSVIQPGTDPHTFQLSPSDRIELAKAKALISVGLGLEPWFSRMPKAADQDRLVVSDGLPLEKMESEDKTHSHSDSEFQFDPHIWQSPALTAQVAEKISGLLKELDPLEKTKIDSCTQTYLTKIRNQVKELRQEIEKIPMSERILATNHDAFGYFAKEFGFRVISLLGLSDSASPTPKQLKQMIVRLKADRVRAVFLETSGNMSNMQAVAREAGIRIGGSLYGDSLGGPGTGAETTLSLWKTNVHTIVKDLTQKK